MALNDALKAQAAGQKVVIGCDVGGAKRYASYSLNREVSLAVWLKRDGNASKCTALQLQTLQAFLGGCRTLMQGKWVSAN